MARISKRIKEIREKVDLKKIYSISEAIQVLKDVPHAKFDESLEISLNLNVDPKNSQQMVRGAVGLPHGTGKKIRVLVFCSGEQESQAKEAGADYVGAEELVTKVQNGFLDFDAVVSTPDMMRSVGKLGKVLGPRGLMPNPKVGTVTPDVAKAITDLKSGKIEYKMDKLGNINSPLGKLSFDINKLEENANTLINAIEAAKPVGVKGVFIKKASLSSTMGPGLTIQIS